MIRPARIPPRAVQVAALSALWLGTAVTVIVVVALVKRTMSQTEGSPSGHAAPASGPA